MERVRSQMSLVYRPITVRLQSAASALMYTTKELDFEFLRKRAWKFVKPSEKLWPHTEVHTRDHSPAVYAALSDSGTPWLKFSPADLHAIEEPSKREVYMDAFAGVIIPNWSAVAAIIKDHMALIETPPPDSLAKFFPGLDWPSISSGSLTLHLFDFVASADAWVALERKWAAGNFTVRAHCSTSHVSL